MKTVSVIFFLLLVGFTVKSQTSEEERPYYYIGKYEHKDLYIQSLFRQKTDQVVLYELNDGKIIEFEKITLQNSLIHQLYCHNERFYAITSTTERDKFYLTSFDESLKQKESVEILTLSKGQLHGLDNRNYFMKFFRKGDQAAVIMLDTKITVCAVNFSSLASKTFNLPAGLNTNFVSDVYFDGGLNLYLSRRDELFLFKNGDLSQLEVNHEALQGDISELRFIENDEEPYLISMVANGETLKGFVYCPLNPKSIQLKECVLSPEKTNHQDKKKVAYNSFLKAEISDNKIFCSMQRTVQAINETIMISCIDIAKQENLWNFQVLSIHDAPYIWEENRNSLNHASFSFIQGDKLFFFFNAAVKKLNPENFFETDKRVITSDISIQTTIVKSEIDIQTGEHATKPIHEDYTSESFKIFNASYHVTDKNELYFITYKEFSNKPYYEMLKPEKKVEVIRLD
jgi:hypothetical protein